MNSRFERISSTEREKEYNEEALAAGFNVQFKGTYRKCGEYCHKTDSRKCPENKGTNGNKNSMSGNSKSVVSENKRSNTKCWNCGKLGHKQADCPEKEKANQAVDNAWKCFESDDELDLVLCTMDDVIIEHLIEESISTANEFAARMQDNQQKKRVQFVEKVDKAKKDLHMNNKKKIKRCNIDGHSFYPFIPRTWIGDSGAFFFITNNPTGIYDAEPINESIELQMRQ